LAGHGSRFSKAGYEDPKPIIPVSGKPMIIQAANSLPNSETHRFVTLKEHLNNYPLEDILKDEFPNSKIISIDTVTSGQAITCELGLGKDDDDKSLLIAATDNGMIYDNIKYQELLESNDVDAIIFTFKNHVSSKNNPQMYGWVKTDGNDNAADVSVKVPISNNPYNDHAIVGTFYIKKVAYFKEALKSLLDKDIKVNGEYYVDSLMGELIDLGFNVKVFEIEDYICWGTPDDYETFVYWQSFFHKVSWHPYRLEKDLTVNKDKIGYLDKKYSYFTQEFK
jgi:NDP-sugar pyrophosphorylase family protein